MSGKVVLVTGSSSGIGAAIARAFSEVGAAVMTNSSSGGEAAAAVARSLEGGAYLQADVSDQQQAARLVAGTIEEFGRLDVVVNNAGTTEFIPHADLDAVTLDVWRSILAVNLLGPWSVTRAAVPHLRTTGAGLVINISSVAGLRPIASSSVPYAVSKAALNHMTILLAKALGPQIRVNAIAPGLIETPWSEDWQEAHAYVRENVPLRRSGLPDDVAAACLGLTRSEYTTGAVLMVDGGLSLV